jgi:hypothetical protein
MSYGKDFVHMLSISGCTLRRLLLGCLIVGTSYHALVVHIQLHPYVAFSRMSYSRDFVSRTCCAYPAAPLGSFCLDLSYSKDFVSRTCCAYPAAPLGDFCSDLSHARVV